MEITTSNTITLNITIAKGRNSTYSADSILAIVTDPSGAISTIANAASAITNSTATADGSITIPNIPTTVGGVYKVSVYETSSTDIDSTGTTPASVSSNLLFLCKSYVRKITATNSISVSI